MADDNGKRRFLDSYGAYFLAPNSANVNFNPDVNVSLQMPVQTVQQATAPDSISVWDLNSDNTWHKVGYAKRTGNVYTQQITHKGYWNFAVLKDGVYITLHLRTSSGIPVVNTRIKLKSRGGEVADARTDSEGNAVVFVPAKEPITLDLINDHYYNWSSVTLIDQPLGSFSAATEKTFTVPDRSDLVTIKGNVFACDGTPITNGTVILFNNAEKDDVMVPVTNGKFAMSAWINYAYNFAHMAISDNSGKLLDTTSVVLGSAMTGDEPKQYTINLYGCPNTPQLYCNYLLDSTAFSITGQPGSNNPPLIESNDPPGVDIITMGDNTKGISFMGWFTSVGGNFFSWSDGVVNLPTGLKVNGVNCKILGSSEIVITRQDGIIGGYVEGWFSIHYSDNKNQPHKVTGNFRVRRAA
jgi:hypothetical protein